MSDESKVNSLMCQLIAANGDEFCDPMLVNLSFGSQQLQTLYDTFRPVASGPMRFIVEGYGVVLTTIGDLLAGALKEENIRITCVPKSPGFVRPVCRCTSSLPGHQDVILTMQFSLDNCFLATGSGDCTVRIWDTQTETPVHTLDKFHSDWVLDLVWSGSSSNRSQLASAGREAYVGCICWEPSGTGEVERLASGSKDCSIRIWNVLNGQCEQILNGHTQGVQSLKWTTNYIYSGSQDRSVRVWNVRNKSQSVICLNMHAHWVNSVDVFSTDTFDSVASASDDHCIALWKSNTKPKSFLKLHGHCQPVIHVRFSPDGSMIASASFDRSVRIWDAVAGKHLMTFNGHVGRVYRIVWSPDSRYVVSASADSTVKLWNVNTKKLSVDLPGHEDEVYSLDWSLDGLKVATGGKDKMLKLWRR